MFPFVIFTFYFDILFPPQKSQKLHILELNSFSLKRKINISQKLIFNLKIDLYPLNSFVTFVVKFLHLCIY